MQDRANERDGIEVADEEEEQVAPKPKAAKSKTSPRKRKADTADLSKEESRAKKPRRKAKNEKSTDTTSSAGPAKPSVKLAVTSRVTLKLGPPKVKEPETFPCCLCVSVDTSGLLRVHDPPTVSNAQVGSVASGQLMAHEDCARVIPETWVDDVDIGYPAPDGSMVKEKVVFGVDAIVRDRWNLVSIHRSDPAPNLIMSYVNRNARIAQRLAAKLMEPLFSARKANAPRRSMFLARAMAPTTTLSGIPFVRSRKRLFC